MRDLHLLDHLYFLITVGVIPAFSALRIRDSLKYIAEGGEPARIAAYRQIILIWFTLTLVLLGLWLHLERGWPALGFRWPTEGTLLLGVCGTAAFLGFVALSLQKFARAEDPDRALQDELGDLIVFLPTSRREEGWFSLVSLNAGISEEIIFRGYLLWYLAFFLDGLWAAVVATLLFTWAHAYQGLKLLPGIAITSAVMVALYLYTDSLLLPIVLHILVDALQGRYFARFRRAANTRRHVAEQTL